jgi:hypothetical protein
MICLIILPTCMILGGLIWWFVTGYCIPVFEFECGEGRREHISRFIEGMILGSVPGIAIVIIVVIIRALI